MNNKKSFLSAGLNNCSSNKVNFWILIVTFSLLSILIVGGAKRFIISPQITYYFSDIDNHYQHEVALPLADKLSRERLDKPSSASIVLHVPRIMLIYPIVVLHRLFNWDIHIIFSFMCITFLIFFTRIMDMITNINALYCHKFSEANREFSLSFISILTFCISLFMHGRMIFSFLGMSILAFLVLYGRVEGYSRGMGMLFLVSFLFCSVSSSSIMMFSFFSILVLLNPLFRENISPRIGVLLGIGSVLVVCLGVIAIHKVILSFDTGSNTDIISHILRHGYGEIFIKVVDVSPVLGWASVISYVLMLIFFFSYLLYRVRNNPLGYIGMVIIFFSFLFGLIGYGALSFLCLPLICGLTVGLDETLLYLQGKKVIE